MALINNAFVQQFSDDLITLSQQKGSKLLNTVRQHHQVGKSAHFDRIGATVAQQKTSRHAPTTYTDTPHSRRTVTMSDWFWSELVDKSDDLRMIIDPRSPYATNGANALGRSMDSLIIAAATGNATSTDADDTASNVALPAGQIIDNDFGTGNSNLTIEKLIEAKRILVAGNVDMDEEYVCVVNAHALYTGLMNQTEVQSFDYNSVKALVRGDIDTFMGFKFQTTELLLGDGTADTNPKLCLAYAKSGIGFALGSDIAVKVDELPGTHYSTQLYADFTGGAVRVEDEKVISIECVQA